MPGKTVTDATRPASGSISIADPRLGCKPRNGSYGVMDWDNPAKTVIGAGDIHAGNVALADSRIPQEDIEIDKIPENNERGGLKKVI